VRSHPRRRRTGDGPALYVAGGQTVPTSPGDDPTPTGLIDLGPADPHPVVLDRGADHGLNLTTASMAAESFAAMYPGVDPAEIPGYHLNPPRPPADLLAGAVRAELLADDWRAEVRETSRTLAEVAPSLVEPFERIAEHMAEAELDQGDDPDDEPGGYIVVPDSGYLVVTEPDAAEPIGDAPVGPGGGEWAEVEAASDRDFDDPAPPTDTLGRVHDWISRHDPRSLEHGVRAVLNARAPLQDRLWPHGPVFDQGTAPPLPVKDASGCTGYSMAAALNALGGSYTADDALDLYLAAQRRDHVPGESYPGTSVLAAAQEAKARGWISGYVWGFGVGDVAQGVMQVGPVVLGIPWLDQMQVDADGVLTPGGERGGLGHAIACIGILREHAGRPGPWFVLQQSYGPAVGVGGLLYLHVDHLRLLLRGVGEACIPIVSEEAGR
jgi:hypothetical protein